MARYRKKPVEIDGISFDEFVEYAKANTPAPHWHIEYNGHKITHENDQLYLIPTDEGVMNFTPNDMLLTGVNGEVYPCKMDVFEKTYEQVLK